MDIQDINYPGFNRSLDELNAITKLKKKSCEILDFTEIEWVRKTKKERNTKKEQKQENKNKDH